MAFIEKFLGKRVEIPEDRRYDSKQGLWAKPDREEIIFGLSEPALVLVGGLNDLDWLVPEGETVEEGQTVMFTITGKIMYLDCPIKGRIHFNSEVKQSPSFAVEDPYKRGWLFRVKPNEDVDLALNRLANHLTYTEGLKTTEGFKNPDGLKGGVSGICKAVYTGIREQKI